MADPSDQQQSKRISFLILLLPFFIFAVSSGFVLYSWILDNTLTGIQINPLVFIPVYFQSFLGLVDKVLIA